MPITQLQNKSLEIIDRARTAAKCTKMKNAWVKQAKHVFFIVKDANLSIHVWHCHHGYQSFLRFTTAQLGRINNILPIRGLEYFLGW